VPPPDFAGDPHFRTDNADYANFREHYANYDRHAEVIHDIVANHPEFAGIPENDLVGIRGYTTNDYYRTMNEALRTGDQAVIDQYAAHARSAVSGLNQLPPHEGVVFRGINFESAGEAKQVADAYVPGTVYEEPAFFSTDVAKSFEGNVQFEVRSTNGRYVYDLSASNLTEEEVLFPPGTRFNVLDKFFDKDTKTWHIGLEDIP
jgi:hypothetical protein